MKGKLTHQNNDLQLEKLSVARISDFEQRLNDLTSKLFESEAREIQLTDKITDLNSQLENAQKEESRPGLPLEYH